MNYFFYLIAVGIFLVLFGIVGFMFVVVRNEITKAKKIVVPESLTKQLDHDKIAKGLGAKRVGKLEHKAAGGYFGALQTAAQRPVAPTIIQATKDFQIKLADAFTVAGLPTDPSQIIGQNFSFEADVPDTAEHRTLIGVVVGIETSNLKNGVDLYLSTRRFNGIKIERLHIEYVDFLNEFLILKDGSAIPGQFRLLNG